jgi:hypothetical protein
LPVLFFLRNPSLVWAANGFAFSFLYIRKYHGILGGPAPVMSFPVLPCDCVRVVMCVSKGCVAPNRCIVGEERGIVGILDFDGVVRNVNWKEATRGCGYDG